MFNDTTHGNCQVMAIEEGPHLAAEPYFTENLVAPDESSEPFAFPRGVLTDSPEEP
jgi:hypothetical protein